MKKLLNFLFLFPAFIQSQNIDTALVEFNCKMYLFYENYNFEAPTKEELKCYIEEKKDDVKVIFLKQSGFGSDFIFVKTYYDFKNDTFVTKNAIACAYRIHHSIFYNSGPYYIISFNTKMNLLYRLNGFVTNDSRRFYNDYIYWASSEDKKKARSKSSFIKNHFIDGLDLKMLWDRDIGQKFRNLHRPWQYQFR